MIIVSCSGNEDNQEIEKTLIVASVKADCVGLDAQKCLLIKEKGQQEWGFLYDSIVNFTYEEGFEYELLVIEKHIENPPQDGSSIQYILVKMISKTEKTSENLPN